MRSAGQAEVLAKQTVQKQKIISASTKTYDIADYSTIRKLSANYFYVKIRAYKKAGKNTYYGKWKKLKISEARERDPTAEIERH